jgi:LCP family protein required for cell wall assembly
MSEETRPVERARPEATRPHRAADSPPSRPPAGRGPTKGPRPRGPLPWWLWVAAVVAVGVAAVAVHFVARGLAAAWTETGLNPFRLGEGDTRARTLEPGETPSLEIPEVTPVPWSGDERVTILLMGLDYRDWSAGGGPPRTDSMMVITFEPLTGQAGMLSVPRDLWVEIPGFGHNRINAAYPNGEGSRLPGGGAGLAMQTVENLLGVPIQYYVIIEFQAFERMIDEIGGIDVLVEQPMRIAPIGRPSMALDVKPYHFDGAEALAYARARRTEGGDFSRARRQQQVALAILDRVLGIDAVPMLVAKAPSLYQELASGIRTNLALDQMIALGWMAIQTPRENIRSGVIGPPNMVGFYTLPEGANVLRPVPDQIRLLRDEIFAFTSALGPDISALTNAAGTP